MKKQALIGETTRMVLAVLCIIFLVIFAYQLYSIFTTKSKLAQAKSTLNDIVDLISKLNDGEQKIYLAVAPKEWYILGYNDPLLCPTGKCLCICEEPNRESCKLMGACKDMPLEYYPLLICESESANFCLQIVSLEDISIKRIYGKISFYNDNYKKAQENYLDNLLVYKYNNVEIKTLIENYINLESPKSGSPDTDNVFKAIQSFFKEYGLGYGSIRLETKRHKEEGWPLPGEGYFDFWFDDKGELTGKAEFERGIRNLEPFNGNGALKDKNGRDYILTFQADTSNARPVNKIRSYDCWGFINNVCVGEDKIGVGKAPHNIICPDGYPYNTATDCAVANGKSGPVQLINGAGIIALP